MVLLSSVDEVIIKEYRSVIGSPKSMRRDLKDRLAAVYNG